MISKTAQPDQEEISLFLYIEACKILQHLFIGLPINSSVAHNRSALAGEAG
jgi:hypothetical protein